MGSRIQEASSFCAYVNTTYYFPMRANFRVWVTLGTVWGFFSPPFGASYVGESDARNFSGAPGARADRSGPRSG